MKASYKDSKGLQKMDYVFLVSMVGMALYYTVTVFQISTPLPDGGAYLENANDWLHNQPLFETFRPPLLSWMIAGVWSFTGESWIYVKWINAAFTLAAGAVLYLTIRRIKGGFFAYLVAMLTLVNSQIFLHGVHLLTEGISLFFLVLTLYFSRSENKSRWYLAGIAVGMTFLSRYFIIVQAIAIIFIESYMRRNGKLFLRACSTALPIIVIGILVLFAKTGTFAATIPKDSNITIFLSSYYILNSITIWGYAFLLVPLAFLFKKTYADKNNVTFVFWFLVSLIFWSSNTTTFTLRYAIQYTPAVYYLAILAIENLATANLNNGFLAIRGLRQIGSINRNVVKESLHGIVSLVILGVITYLYFTNFYLAHFKGPIQDSLGNVVPLTGALIDYVEVKKTNITFPEYPKEKTIILRLDDVQAWAWNNISINITETVLKRNIPITMAVIPENLERDPIMRNYLISKRNDSRVEIAQHGTNHTEEEYGNLTAQEAKKTAAEGLQKIISVLGVKPITFIPPENVYNKNATDALQNAGFLILSAGEGEYRYDGRMLYKGYDIKTKEYDQEYLENVEDIADDCHAALEQTNVCVVMIHPQDYVSSDKRTLSAPRFAFFIDLLNRLQKFNATFATFSSTFVRQSK